MDALWQDVRYAMRSLARQPGFTALAVLTLAVGIGANTVIFTGVHALLLQPLAYPEAERLVVLSQVTPDGQETGVSFPDLTEWRAAGGVYSRMSAARTVAMNLVGRDATERVTGSLISEETLPLLGGRAWLGRTFVPEEQRPGGAKVVLLAYAFWQGRLGADPGAVGRSLRLDDESFTIVGVMPPAFLYPLRADLWLPLEANEPASLLCDASAGRYEILARLAPGVTLDRASRETARLQQRSVERRAGRTSKLSLRVTRLQDALPAAVKYRKWLCLLQGAVILVLLIASVNVASLLLARHAGRRQEFAIRLALGGGPARLTRLLLVESLLLGLLGAAFGLVLAHWGLGALVAALPWRVPGVPPIGLNLPVLCVTLAVSLATSLGFGLAPARIASRTNLNEALKAGERSATLDPRRRRLGGGLIVAEVALSVVLLVATGLMIRTLLKLAEESPGFDPERAIAISLSPPRGQEGAAVAAFNQEAVRRLRAVAGVESVGGISFMPLVGYNPGADILAEGRGSDSSGQWSRADYEEITPDYFRAMGIPLLRGRHFAEAEMGPQPGVVIVNQSLAARFWPAGDALGRRLQLAPEGGPRLSLAIVGVVADVKQFGLHTAARPELYLPRCSRSMTLIVRTVGDPTPLLPSVREAVQGLAGRQAAFNLRTLRQTVRDSTERRRVFAWLLGALGALALALTAAGVYGVLSHLTAERMQEMGIRLALGASAGDVLGLVLRRGLALVSCGVVCGLVAACALAPAMRSLLFGVTPLDPLAFFGATIVLLAVTLAACGVPARRAARCDPVRALRHE